MNEVPPHQDFFNFPFLDDVFLLSNEERQKKISQSNFLRIGPLVEYALIDQDSSHTLHQLNNNITQKLLNVVRNHREEPRTNTVSAKPFEFFKPPLNDAAFEENAWVAFCMRLQNAAKSSGLNPTFAKQLVGTFEEMVGNITEHSEFPETGIVGYRWKEKEFEYVVADNGVGIMESLKKHPDYSDISDAGNALETALKDGESCKGKQSQSGRGFNTLILNIASRNSFLRFRSGDHCHLIDGTKDTAVRATSQLSSTLKGFHVSVVCRSQN